MVLGGFAARCGFDIYISHSATAYCMNQFDELFQFLFYFDRKVVMRAANALKKITLNQPEYLRKHKSDVLKLCQTAKNTELKWHGTLLVTRVPLTQEALGTVWQTLTCWATDLKESKSCG